MTRFSYRTTLFAIALAAVSLVMTARGQQTMSQAQTPAGQQQAAIAQPQSNTVDTSRIANALYLLQRLEDVLDQTLGNSSPSESSSDSKKKAPKGAVGTGGNTNAQSAVGGTPAIPNAGTMAAASVPPIVVSGSSQGKVTVERAKLEEMRAEVEQLKSMLQR